MIGMSVIEHELASQPEVWRKAAALAENVGALLPQDGMRVAAVGCGTSYYVAKAFAGLREVSGAGETDAWPASEAPPRHSYDMVVAISRSGTTTEVLRLLEGLPSSVICLAICAVPDSPVVSVAADSIVLEFADEESVVQTRFATATLALHRAHLGEDVEVIARAGEQALVSELPVRPSDFDHFVFLGRGWTVGLADEAALKLRETAGAWSESYPAMEYRHGPISVAGPKTVVWTLGAVEADVIADIRTTGATIVRTDIDPLADLVRVHRAAVSLAAARGMDPDHPRHLERSVVLT